MTIVPTLFGPKPRAFPEKYAHRLNSALGGPSYRAKTPGFHDPITLENTKHAKKTKPHYQRGKEGKKDK
jgi:hypothetical protein